MAFLREEKVDLILLDMIMEPEMDGLDTYQRILEFNPGQKVIIVSGYSETDRIKKALELGVHSYIKKPYGIENFVRTIHKVLARNNLRLNIRNLELYSRRCFTSRLFQINTAFFGIVFYSLIYNLFPKNSR